MELEITKLTTIVDDILDANPTHRKIRRIRRYKRRLEKLSTIELNLFITMELLPHYIHDTIDVYVEKHICKTFKICINDSIKKDINDILNNMCLLILSA